jgi:hypothetical protein
MAQKRIYVVADQSDRGCYLVRAPSPAGAINRIVRNRYTAESASQEQIVELMGLGAPVIDVDDIPAEAPEVDDKQTSLLDGEEDSATNDPAIVLAA